MRCVVAPHGSPAGCCGGRLHIGSLPPLPASSISLTSGAVRRRVLAASTSARKSSSSCVPPPAPSGCAGLSCEPFAALTNARGLALPLGCEPHAVQLGWTWRRALLPCDAVDAMPRACARVLDKRAGAHGEVGGRTGGPPDGLAGFDRGASHGRALTRSSNALSSPSPPPTLLHGPHARPTGAGHAEGDQHAARCEQTCCIMDHR